LATTTSNIVLDRPPAGFKTDRTDPWMIRLGSEPFTTAWCVQ